MYRVFPSVFSQDDVRNVRAFLEQVKFIDGSGTTERWVEGKKHNSEADPKASQALGDQVLGVLGRHLAFEAWCSPVQASRPLFNRHSQGDYYRRHEDNPVQAGMRADLSYTVFFSDPDSYEGGELELELAGETRRFKEPAGSVLVYESGIPHAVATVRSGSRYAAVGWLQSGIPDHRQRELLYEFRQNLDGLHQRHGGSEEFDRLVAVMSKLTRWWYQPK